MTDPRILFVGSLRPFLTTRARYDALRELGLAVQAVDPDSFTHGGSRLTTRLNFWTLLTPQVFRLNRRILETARDFEPNVTWIEKGTYVFPRTLERLRSLGRMKLVYHNTDDWKVDNLTTRVHWRYLLRAIDRYDIHVTSNLHNVQEFREAGFESVHHMELAANPAVEDSARLSEETRRELGAAVGFIGHWEPPTERLLSGVARAGMELKIYGGGWSNADRQGPLREAIQDRFVWGAEYARTIRAIDVNIGIVSSMNRSHTASRTFQIPALGAFLLHQRNELVTRYFKEGEEAAFFESADELIDKCRHYLDHPDERRRIAGAGRRRCFESGYFETDRVREIVDVLRREIADL